MPFATQQEPPVSAHTAPSIRRQRATAAQLPDSLRVLWLNFTRPPRPWNKIRAVKTLFPQLHARLLNQNRSAGQAASSHGTR